MKGKCFKKKLRGENKSGKANKNKTWNKSNFKKIYQENGRLEEYNNSFLVDLRCDMTNKK